MSLANVLQPLMSVEESLLEGLHSIGLGWGLAIVALTLLVRLALVPLTVRQVRSQRELKRHMPELARLRVRHKDDPERLRSETLAYYQEHGVNPLTSLLPTLLQVPVLISLYYLMRTDVSSGMFGHAGFLFIPELGQRPHGSVLFALVMLYLTTQLATSAVSTRTLEGGQRKLALALPLLFVGAAARFPAGLLVYWITSSLWSFGQAIAVWRSAPAAEVTSAPPARAPTPTPTPARRTDPAATRKRRRRKRR